MTEEAVPLEEALEEYRSDDFFLRYRLLQLLVNLHCIINHIIDLESTAVCTFH